ncbi:hypothetical protein AB0368_01860 [Actinoplanes sp. NPDC051475]|uniref:hypothetical protein n=1 Tax=Actinoplanes sp. NPDC051475 TaxID=3157225 RepID=UPI00344C0E1E
MSTPAAPLEARLLRGLLAGIGEPCIGVRLGYPESATPVPPAPRREPSDVIEKSRP